MRYANLFFVNMLKGAVSALVLFMIFAVLFTKPARGQEGFLQDFPDDTCGELAFLAGIMMYERQFNSDQEEAARGDFDTALGIASGSAEGQMLIEIFNGAWDSPVVAPNLRQAVISDYAATIQNRCVNEGWE